MISCICTARRSNRYILLYKTWRWRTLLLMLPGLALADLLDLAHSLRMGRNGLKASLLAWGWVLQKVGAVVNALFRANARVVMRLCRS